MRSIPRNLKIRPMTEAEAYRVTSELTRKLVRARPVVAFDHLPHVTAAVYLTSAEIDYLIDSVKARG